MADIFGMNELPNRSTISHASSYLSMSGVKLGLESTRLITWPGRPHVPSMMAIRKHPPSLALATLTGGCDVIKVGCGQ
jgi:hypothetical protein